MIYIYHMFGTNINNKGKIEKNSKVKEGECIFPFKYKYKEIVILVISIFTISFLTFKSDFVNEYRKNTVTYNAFYSENLFRQIDTFIGKPKNSYGVVSIGIHPSIARYNEFNTLDGYLPIYSLEYKHKFRKIIEKELEKNKKLKKYYDEWGSRCYVFSSQLGKNWLNTKGNNPTINIELNTDVLYDMGGKYIFSANKISNEKDNNVELLKVFEEKSSSWEIYLYEIISNR